MTKQVNKHMDSATKFLIEQGLYVDYIPGENMSIEIQRLKEIRKGAVTASFDAKIIAWGLTIRDCILMEKDGRSWIAFPSKKYESDGQTKYWDHVVFEKEVKERISNAIKEQVRQEMNKAKEEPPKSFGGHLDDDIPF